MNCRACAAPMSANDQVCRRCGTPAVAGPRPGQPAGAPTPVQITPPPVMPPQPAVVPPQSPVMAPGPYVMPPPGMVPQPPAIPYKGVWARLFAQLVDGIIYFLFAWLYARATGQGSSAGFELVGGPAMITFGVLLIYFVVMEGMVGGTLGKLILGMRVVGANGRPPGIGRAFVRNLLRLVDILPFAYLVGIIAVVASDRKQRLGDRVAGTFVTSVAGARALQAPPAHRGGGGGAWIAILFVAIVAGGAYFFWPTETPPLFRGGGSGPSLGTATYKTPAPEKVIQTRQWGYAPTNQVIVQLASGAGRRDADQLAASLGGSVVGEIEFAGVFLIETKGATEADLTNAISAASKTQGVSLAGANSLEFFKEPGVRCSILGDSYAYAQGQGSYPYRMIGLEAAYNMIRASGVKLNGVHVGVVDSALYAKSSDIGGQVKVSGLDQQDSTATANTDAAGNPVSGGLNHGTQVTHMIAADWGNSGVMGVAGGLGQSLNVTVRNAGVGKTLTPALPNPKDAAQVTLNGATYTFNTFAHVQKQIEGGATIINYSMGSNKPEPANQLKAQLWRQFLTRMAKDHPEVLFVAAAGNEGGALDGQNYSLGGQPLPNVITVGAVDAEGKRASFSNFATKGGEVTLAAQGANVPTGVGADGKLVYNDGTSFAAPQVTGAAAVLRSINPKLSAAEIKQILVETAGTEVAVTGRITQVDPALGGRVLRLDNAILRVINDVRKAQGLPVVDRATLEKLAAIDGSSVMTAPQEYTIKAVVPAVGKGGVDVQIEMQGPGSIGGLTKKHLDGPGEVSWPFKFLNATDQATLKVTRLDTGACVRMPIIQPAATKPATPQPPPTQPQPAGGKACVGVTLADMKSGRSTIKIVQCSAACVPVGGARPSDADLLKCMRAQGGG